MTFVPSTWNFTIYQGSRFDKTLTIEGYNFADYLARMQIREDFADKADSVVLSLTESDYLTFTRVDATTATLVIDVGGDITKGLPRGSYVHDIELYTTEQNVRRVAGGTVTISKEVTRD